MSGKEKHGFRSFIIFLLILCLAAGTVFFLLPQNERETVIMTVKGWFGLNETYVSGELVSDSKTKAATKTAKTAVKKKSDKAEDIVVSWISNVIRVLEKKNTKALSKLVGKDNVTAVQKIYKQNPVTRNEKHVVRVVGKDADHIYFGLIYGNDPTNKGIGFQGRLTRKEGYWQFDCSDAVNTVLNTHACNQCGGSGLLREYTGGGGVCGFCGGTGQVYNPYLFLDGFGNWQGGYTACSGCGGTGHTGGGSSVLKLCPSCGGTGLK